MSSLEHEYMGSHGAFSLKVETGCWFVSDDIFDWSFAPLIAPLVTTTSITRSSKKSRMETFRYWLTQVHLENGR